MRENTTYMFVHLVWSTWDRVPILTAMRKEAVYSCIQAECSKLTAEVVAIGGTEDHVHLLISYPINLITSNADKADQGRIFPSRYSCHRRSRRL